MKFLSKLTSFLQLARLNREMEEEMRLHLERRIDENLAAGMSPEEASFAAQRRFHQADYRGRA